MILERGLRHAFRNFSTLFLLVACFALPLHLTYSYVFRNVIAVADLRSAIEQFPEARQVRSVGRDQLRQADWSYWGLQAIELVLLPLLVKGTRRVIEVEEAGGVPGLNDALRHSFRTDDQRHGRPPLGPVASAALFALAVGFLVEKIGLLLVEPVGADAAWTGVGLAQAIARSAGAPFFLATWAQYRLGTKEETPFPPKVY